MTVVVMAVLLVVMIPYLCVDFSGGICGGVEVTGGTTICTIMLVLASVAISLISIRTFLHCVGIDLFNKWRLLHGNEARMLYSQ